MNEIAEVASSVSLSAAEVESLRQWLKMNLPDKGQLKQVEKCDGGQSNPTYLLTMDDGQYIIRCKPGPAAQLLRSAHAIEREYRLMHALRNSDVPVPAVHVLCEDESVIGCAFYVMDFVDGRLFWDPSLPGLSKSERAAIYDRMNNVIATLHNLDPESIGLGDYGRGAGYLTRQVKRWTTQYRATQTESIPEMERLIQWLPENTPESDDTAIVHGDFRIDNLIFDHASEKVLAVLDWELSTLGHPLADFSYHCLSWHLSASRFGALGGGIWMRWVFRNNRTM